MAKLIFLLDGNILKEYALDKERMTVGRRSSNDIYIDNLAISGEHAILVTIDGSTYCEDLNSTNGTLINQKKIKKQTLKHGDEIGLGKYILKFLSSGAAEGVPSNGFSDTVLVEPKRAESKEKDVAVQAPNVEEPVVENVPEGLRSEQVEAEVEPAAAGSEQPKEPSEQASKDGAESQAPHLKILNGEDAGGALLLDKSMVKVGQPGEQVAVVTKRQDGYFITHVAGNDHPSINGKSIGAQAYPLKHRDEIEIMGVRMEFCEG